MTDDAAKLLDESGKNDFTFLKYITEGFVLFETICNEVGQLVDLRFLEIHPALESQHDLKSREILGKTVREVLPWIENQWFTEYDKVVQTDKPRRFEQYSAQMDQWYNVYAYIPREGRLAALFHEITWHKRATKALQQSEEKYRKLLEIAQEGIWVIDRNEITTFVNPCMAKMLGYSVSEMIGKHLFEFMDDQGSAIWKKNMERRQNGVKARHDFELIRRDGARLYTIMTTTPIYNDQGEYTESIAMVTDITERRQTEEALKKSEEKLRAIFESSPVIIVLIGIDQIVLDCNQATVEILGFESKDELIGKDCFAFIAETDQNKVRKAWHKGLIGRRVKDLEVTLLKKDHRPMSTLLSVSLFRNSQGDPYAILAIINDISERRENELKYSKILASALNGFCIVNLEGKILEVNQAFCQMLGYTAQELLTMSIMELEAVEEPAGIFHHINAFKKKKGGHFLSRCRRKDGSIIDVEINATYLDIGEGRMVTFVRDITEQKKAEEALRESRERFKKLFYQSPIAIELYNSEGQLVDINQACLDMLRITDKESILGRKLFHTPYIPPGARVKLLKGEIVRYETSVDFEKMRMEKILPTARPGQGDFYVIMSAIKTGKSLSGFLVLIEDFTERNRTKAELMESQSMLETVIASMSDGLAIVDTEGNYIQVNDALAHMCKFESKKEFFNNSSELTGVLEGYTLDGKQISLEEAPTQKALHGETLMNYELVLKRKDTKETWVANYSCSPVRDQDGNIIAAVTTARDTTEQKKIEEALREAERRNRELLDAIPQLVWTSDSEGRCDFLSRQWVEYTGIPASEQLGYRWLDQIYPDDRELICDAWKQVIASGELLDVRFRIRGADGGYRWFRSRAVALRNTEGAIVKWFGTSTDVDDQVRAEAALREADRRKDEFLALLSHELRNPLAAILSSLHILDSTTLAGEQAKRAKEVIERQAGQLSRLVEDLLDITRITQNKIILRRQRLEVNELVRRAMEDHRLLFEKKGVGLEAEFSPIKFFVEADEARLGQVVGNLLQNAVKFTDHGGLTRVSVTGDDSERRVVIRVTDNGIGMEPEMLPRLFQPFMQANMTLDRPHDGLGLGLALSRGLIKMHGGEIKAESRGLGKGSEFTVALPLQETALFPPDAMITEESKVLPVEPPIHGRRVLIIDDNIDLVESLQELLELYEHEVAVAYNGPDGLAKAREFQPDVLLCDIGLPGMDGYEVAKAFREDKLLKNTFLIALTGYAQPKDAQKAFEAGFHQRLVKPVDVDALEQIIAGIPAKK